VDRRLKAGCMNASGVDPNFFGWAKFFGIDQTCTNTLQLTQTQDSNQCYRHRHSHSVVTTLKLQQSSSVPKNTSKNRHRPGWRLEHTYSQSQQVTKEI